MGSLGKVAAAGPGLPVMGAAVAAIGAIVMTGGILTPLVAAYAAYWYLTEAR